MRITANQVDIAVKIVLAFGLLIVGLSNRQLSGDVSSTAEAQVCRFDIDAEVTSIGDQIDAKIAEVVVGAARDDQPAVSKAGQELEVLVERLYPAIQDRNKAAEDCRED